MATRVTQFFAERNEVDRVLTEVGEKLNTLLYAKRGETLEVLTDLPKHDEGRVFIGTELQTKEALESGASTPSKWGLVLLDLPFRRDKMLTMTVLASRTDWSEDGRRRQSPASGRLQKRIESLLKEYLRFPVWAYNRQTDKSERYSRIGYTEGAATLSEEGGTLAQEGVANIEYLIRPPNH